MDSNDDGAYAGFTGCAGQGGKQVDVPVVKSAVRSVDILEYVGMADQPPGFAQIGADLEIPNSSLFYLLSTLVQRGYLHQEPNRGRYFLGPALAALAASGGAEADWHNEVEDILSDLWSHTNETISFHERRGDEVECRLVKLASHSLLSMQRVGDRVPLYASSSGKIVLADMSDKELDLFLDRTELRRFTPNTLTTGKTIRADVQRVKREQVAVSREELACGIIGLATGLYIGGALIGVLGVAVPAVRYDEEVHRTVAAQLLAASRHFAERKGSAEHRQVA